jgi:hypothetical protein
MWETICRIDFSFFSSSRSSAPKSPSSSNHLSSIFSHPRSQSVSCENSIPSPRWTESKSRKHCASPDKEKSSFTMQVPTPPLPAGICQRSPDNTEKSFPSYSRKQAPPHASTRPPNPIPLPPRNPLSIHPSTLPRQNENEARSKHDFKERMQSVQIHCRKCKSACGCFLDKPSPSYVRPCCGSYWYWPV